MALSAGEQVSGGGVIDSDRREVVAIGGAPVRVTSGYLAPSQAGKGAQGTVLTVTNVATVIPLWTVTAGKTAYITDIAVYTDSGTLVAC